MEERLTRESTHPLHPTHPSIYPLTRTAVTGTAMYMALYGEDGVSYFAANPLFEETFTTMSHICTSV